MTHPQHIGPIEKYHPPENSRFRWDGGRMASVDPEIEVFDEEYHGREEGHYTSYLRIYEEIYRIETIINDNYDENGKSIYNYKNYKRRPPDIVWTKVFVRQVKKTRFSDPGITVDYSISLLDIIMDFLSLDRTNQIRRKVARIVFAESEMLSCRNYEVINKD